ncbi:MAG: hypothetical protein GY950_05505 [bacterium]|nr:hypothetical protein [bacterium]
MESKSLTASNLPFCIEKLRDFVSIVPRRAGEDVNWEELSQQRHLAEMSLAHLASVCAGKGGTEITVKCKIPGYPKL